MLDRRRFLSATPAALTALACAPSLWAEAVSGLKPPALGFSAKEDDRPERNLARLTTASPKVCKILQVTDFHFLEKTSAEDELTISDCRKQVERHQPDLLVLSGDLLHDNPMGRGERGLELVLKSFPTLGVPWTICWGNHDLLADYQRGHDLLEQSPKSLYRGGASHGDYLIGVRAAGSEAKDAAALD